MYEKTKCEKCRREYVFPSIFKWDAEIMKKTIHWDKIIMNEIKFNNGSNTYEEQSPTLRQLIVECIQTDGKRICESCYCRLLNDVLK